MEARFWRTSLGWEGVKIVDGLLYQLAETDDRSFSEQHSYVWRAKDGTMLHLTDEERELVPDPGVILDAG